MKRLLYIMIVLFAFNQVNGQQVRRVKEASKMTAVTDTSDVDKTAGKMYVYDDKYWVGHGTGLRQMSTGVSASGVYVEIEDSTAANKGYYATFKSVEDSAAQLRADLLAPPVLLSQGGTGTVLADGTAGQVPRSSGLGTVGWSTATYPHTVSANELMYGSGANVFGTLSTLNHALLQTDGSGTPAWWTPTASRVLQTDASGDLSSSAITTTELGYLDNASSEIQGQLNGKMDDLVDDTTPQLGADLDGQGYYALDLQNIPDLAASGPGLRFDGNDDKVDCGTMAASDLDFGTGDFSYYIDFKVNATGATNYMFGARKDANDNMYFMINSSGTINFYAEMANTAEINYISNAVQITANINYGLAIVGDRDNTLYMYKNGKSVVLTETEAIDATDINIDGAFLFGMYNVAPTGFDGAIHRFLVFNLALTAAEVKALQGAPIPYKYLGAGLKYTSDFSAGENGWTAVEGTAAGNIDDIPDAEGEDDNLRFTCAVGENNRWLSKTEELTVRKVYTISFDYYIPAAQSNVDGIKISVEVGGSPTYSADLETIASWTSTTMNVSQPTADWIKIFALDGGATVFNDAGGDDVFYIRGVTVTQNGCVGQYEPSGITSTTWHEPNGLDGTISGAVVVNPMVEVYTTGNVEGATYASDESVTDAELKYINTLSSNAQDQFDALDPDYGEMNISSPGETTVDVVSTDHPLTDYIEGLSCDHWEFHGNTNGIVTVWSTAAAGDSTNCYDEGHGLSDDDVVYITGTTTADYDGVFVVDVIDVNNFRIGKTFTSDQADNAWVHPDHLTTSAGAEGIYMVTWDISFTCANNFDVFEASVYVNATRQGKSAREHKSKTATDVESVSGHCLIDFSTGDQVHFALRNKTGTGNFTVSYGTVIVNDM